MTWLVLLVVIFVLLALYRRITVLEKRVEELTGSAVQQHALAPVQLQPTELRSPIVSASESSLAVDVALAAQGPAPTDTNLDQSISPAAPMGALPLAQHRSAVPADVLQFEITPARVLAFVGGLLLLGAIGFFVATAISSGLLTEHMQIILGYVVSALVAGAGAVLVQRQGADVARICIGVGAGGWLLTSVAGSQLYDVLNTPTALLMIGMGVAVTVWGALRLESRLLTGFGLLAGCAAPILVGAAATVGVSAALLVMMAATAVVALRRNWPSIAIGMLLITAPQLIPLADGDKKAWIIISSLAL